MERTTRIMCRSLQHPVRASYVESPPERRALSPRGRLLDRGFNRRSSSRPATQTRIDNPHRPAETWPLARKVRAPFRPQYGLGDHIWSFRGHGSLFTKLPGAVCTSRPLEDEKKRGATHAPQGSADYQLFDMRSLRSRSLIGSLLIALISNTERLCQRRRSRRAGGYPRLRSCP